MILTTSVRSTTTTGVAAPARPVAFVPAGVRGSGRAAWLDRVTTLVAGAGAVFIVAHDGTPLWRAIRLLLALTAAILAWRASASSRSASRILGGVATGLVAVPVGVGVGGPHLAKAGLSSLTIAGLAVLVGGTVIFVAAIVRMYRAWRHRVATTAAIGAIVALLLLTWSLGQAVAATNIPRPHLGSATPADAGLAFRDITFPATDAVILSGWYIPSHNGAAVVLLHGAGSTRSNVLDHAVVLARHGYGVLLYDARGHGRSAGRAMDFGWFGDRDIGGAVHFLEQQPDVRAGRIGAVGMSMGGEQAIGAAAGIGTIRAVVAEGATNRVADDKDWLSNEFGFRGALTEAVDRLTYAFADLLTSAGPPIALHDAVRAAAPRPVLLIAAADEPDEPRAGRYIQSSSPQSVELWVVPNTSHTDGLSTHPQEWEARVIGFLDHALEVDQNDNH
jgi:uncharacterized protein